MGVTPLLNLPKLTSLVILPCPLSGEKMQPKCGDGLQESWAQLLRPLGTDGRKSPRPLTLLPVAGQALHSLKCTSELTENGQELVGTTRDTSWVDTKSLLALNHEVSLVSIHISHTVNINCRRTFWFYYLFSHSPSLWEQWRESPHFKVPNLANKILDIWLNLNFR